MIAISGVVTDKDGASVTWIATALLALPPMAAAVLTAQSPVSTVAYSWHAPVAPSALFGASSAGRIPFASGQYIFG